MTPPRVTTPPVDEAAPIGHTLIVEARAATPGQQVILLAIPLTVTRALAIQRWASVARSVRIAQPDVASVTFWDDDVDAFNDAEYGVPLQPEASTLRWQDFVTQPWEVTSMYGGNFALARTLQPLGERPIKTHDARATVVPDPIGSITWDVGAEEDGTIKLYTSMTVPLVRLLGRKWLRTRRPKR